ncbi:MAG: glycerophosphodiester phosphodiesterase [Gemmatimonadaceae bacterium]
MSQEIKVEHVAHRGAKREFPENTLPAFQRAFQLGANGIELDVHVTSDGVVVVHHDSTLGPAARELSGVPIVDIPWRDLNRVRFDSDVAIPSLQAVLAATPVGVTVYAEIKGSGIEELVAADIAASDTRCAVHSFDHDAIARFAEIMPRTRRGILFDRLDGADVPAEMRRTGALDVWLDHRLIDRRLLDAVHGAAGRVIAWTVNDRATAERLARLGVDALCGDDVRLFDAL